MKTPRELLFKRHEAAGPKLDAIRHEVIARHCAAARHEPAGDTKGFFARLWQELVWPCRRTWTGLAAVWALLFIINFANRDSMPTAVAKNMPAAETIMVFRDQEKMLNELLADHSQPAEAARPRSFEPKPRSEISGVVAV